MIGQIPCSTEHSLSCFSKYHFTIYNLSLLYPILIISSSDCRHIHHSLLWIFWLFWIQTFYACHCYFCMHFSFVYFGLVPCNGPSFRTRTNLSAIS